MLFTFVVLGRKELKRDCRLFGSKRIKNGVVSPGHGANGIVTKVTSPAADPEYRTAVTSQLASLVTNSRALLVAVDPAVSDLIDAAVRFTEGGKMLRPTFCHAGWLIAGGQSAAAPIAAAGAAFEWLQASALVHDDLMDGSDTRRGRPSVHREF